MSASFYPPIQLCFWCCVFLSQEVQEESVFPSTSERIFKVAINVLKVKCYLSEGFIFFSSTLNGVHGLLPNIQLQNVVSVNTYLHTNHIKFNLVFFVGQMTSYIIYTML